ncbi:MAG: glycosyltransferase family 2 protein [Candidatus Shapirobacteria bacterium]|nr:glycosyltransferase family 2 protein [Candidatus Shapirobacteria bacterium]
MNRQTLKASVIILNYFGEQIIEETIKSIINLNFPKDKFELIIVDNNSQDKSRKIIKEYEKKYSNIKSLFLKKNLGFAGGNNPGIRIAKGEYVILLNNDCIVDKNWLKELVNLADKNPKIFSISSKLKKYPPTLNLIQNAGSIVFQDGYGRDIGSIITADREQFYEKDIGQFDQEKEVYSSCGAAALYRKSILKKIGLLDENFFMYYEDTEISERARLCGYLNYYCSKAIVYHYHAKSSSEWSPFFIFHTEKGRLLHVFYHFPTKIFIKEYFIFLFKSKVRLIKNLLKMQHSTKKDWQYIRACLSMIRDFPKIQKTRNKYHQLYSQKRIKENYQKILSGYWYFN